MPDQPIGEITVLPSRAVRCSVCGREVRARVFKYETGKILAWPNTHGPHRSQCRGRFDPITLDEHQPNDADDAPAIE